MQLIWTFLDIQNRYSVKLPARIFSPSSGSQIFSWIINSIWRAMFCSLYWIRARLKFELSSDISRCSTWVFSQATGLISSIRLSINSCLLLMSYYMRKLFLFWESKSCHAKSVVKFFHYQLPRFLKSFSAIMTGRIYSIKASTGRFLPIEYSLKHSSILFFAWEWWYDRSAEKCKYFLYVQTHLPSNQRAWFYPSVSQSTTAYW